MKVNQTTLIKEYLLRKGSITSWEAIKRFGCTRLSAKIYELRKEGYAIKSEPVTKKNRYGYTVTFSKYILAKKQK